MQTKDFSILKWIIFPILVLLFGIGIAYVSISIFGLGGSIPSLLLLTICFGISLIFILHTSNHRVKAAMIAAFVFECLGVVALAATLICSIVILREFSGATQTIDAEAKSELEKEKQKTEQIRALANIKSLGAQRTVAKEITKQETKSETETTPKLTRAIVFERAEKFLLYPLIGEAATYLIGLLMVFGLVAFLEVRNAEENELPETPIYAPKNRSRVTLLARNAPLLASNNQSVTDSKGNKLILAGANGGCAIRFQQRGQTAKHVLRITATRKTEGNLESLDYKRLAQWVCAELESLGKSGKDVYAEIKSTI